MLPHIRTQVDGQQAMYSAIARDRMPVEESLARQELAEEADVNYFLSRYGVPMPQPANYGYADYNLDLQGALAAIDDAKEAWRRLDPQLRSRFPDWMSLLQAAERGELNHSESPEKPKEASEGSQGTPA